MIPESPQPSAGSAPAPSFGAFDTGVPTSPRSTPGGIPVAPSWFSGRVLPSPPRASPPRPSSMSAFRGVAPAAEPNADVGAVGADAGAGGSPCGENLPRSEKVRPPVAAARGATAVRAPLGNLQVANASGGGSKGPGGDESHWKTAQVLPAGARDSAGHSGQRMAAEQERSASGDGAGFSGGAAERAHSSDLSIRQWKGSPLPPPPHLFSRC